MGGNRAVFFFFLLSWCPQTWCSEWHLWQTVYGPRCALKVLTYGPWSVPPGPKSLGWILKRVDWRWSWWRTTIRFVSWIQVKTHTHTQAVWQDLVPLGRSRVGNRSTHLCSSWPAPRAANTCGSAPLRVTPSSACVSRPLERAAAATSHDSGPASDSGRDGFRRNSEFLSEGGWWRMIT